MNHIRPIPKTISQVVILLLCFFAVFHTDAQTKQSDSLKGEILNVGLAGSEPFIFQKETSPKGIAIEIWEDLALERKWRYEYQAFDSADDALHELNNGDLDIVVGPLSITSKRLEYVRFSQPFYNSSLAIVSRKDDLSLWDKIKPLFSIKLFLAVTFFLIILAIVGTLLWLAERHESPDQFSEDPVSGIGSGMWLAIVTMSTTGYGDKAPITVWGRIVAGSWMVISIIFATSMVAGIASTLTLSSIGSTTISNIEQLANRKAATIGTTPSETFLKESKVKIVEASDLNDAFKKLKNKEVDAIVYDRPQLLYHLKIHPDENLYLAKAEYYKQGYGFALPFAGTELIFDVNRALLEHAENQETSRIMEYYLDKDE